jgi:hypothetical protein
MAELVTMRNARTGELRPVVAESEEYLELLDARYDHSGTTKPEWEQTGEHHARRLVSGAEEGALEEAQLGYDHKPREDVVNNVSGVGPDPAPELALTPGEIENGLETLEQKQEQLAQQSNQDEVASTHEEALEPIRDSADGIARAPQGEPDAPTAEEREEKQSRARGSKARPKTSRAGGDESRDKEAATAGSTTGSSSSGGGDSSES